MLPELPLLGDDPVATPRRRPLDVVAAPPPELGDGGLELVPAADDLALGRDRRRQPAPERPRSPSSRRTPRRADLLDAPLGPHLPAERVPVDDHGRARVLVELAALAAAGVREERQPRLVGALQQDHPRRRRAVRAAVASVIASGSSTPSARASAIHAVELAERVGVEFVPPERPVAVVHGPSLCWAGEPRRRPRRRARRRGRLRRRTRPRRRAASRPHARRSRAAPADAAARGLGRPGRPEERRPGDLRRLHARRPPRTSPSRSRAAAPPETSASPSSARRRQAGRSRSRSDGYKVGLAPRRRRPRQHAADLPEERRELLPDGRVRPHALPLERHALRGRPLVAHEDLPPVDKPQRVHLMRHVRFVGFRTNGERRERSAGPADAPAMHSLPLSGCCPAHPPCRQRAATTHRCPGPVASPSRRRSSSSPAGSRA